MKKPLVFLLFLTQSFYAMATEQSDCEAASGTFLTGTVVSAPQFQGSRNAPQGIMLSHTHIQLASDQDGQTYDVAIDNVFAADFDNHVRRIPNSLAAIKLDDHLELCGALYTRGTGIHWVHNNCNAIATNVAPNGWVKKIASNGTPGHNLEASQAYCYLWNQ